MEKHPYGQYIPARPQAMIIGSFPIGKFSDPQRRDEIRPHEIDFFFGGEKNLLWKLLGECFKKDLGQKEKIISFLEEQGLAVGDVILACRRKGGRASDSDLYDIEWNKDLLKIIHGHGIKKVYFTSKQVQIWFKRLFPHHGLEEVLLISPSAQSARSVARLAEYQQWKRLHPEGKTREYILKKYREIFNPFLNKS